MTNGGKHNTESKIYLNKCLIILIIFNFHFLFLVTPWKRLQSILSENNIPKRPLPFSAKDSESECRNQERINSKLKISHFLFISVETFKKT